MDEKGLISTSGGKKGNNGKEDGGVDGPGDAPTRFSQLRGEQRMHGRDIVKGGVGAGAPPCAL
jgi:hypothetical protein